MGSLDPDLASRSGFSVESWKFATAFAEMFGSFPTSVTTLVRFLLRDFESNPHSLSVDSHFMLSRFLKSRACQAPYYYGLGFYRPEALVPDEHQFTNNDFIKGLSASEHALFFGLLFFYRSALRFSNAELIEQVTPRLQHAINIGWLVGSSIKSVGGFNGALVSAYRWMGVLPFARHDPDGFAAYMRHLQRNELSRPDIEFEHNRWECNSNQVGLLLLQRLGFGRDRLISLMRATTTHSTLAGLESEEKIFRVADVWVHYLLERRSSPSIPLPPSYYLSEVDIDLITQKLSEPTNTRNNTWLSARKEWLSPGETPELFTPEYMQSLKVASAAVSPEVIDPSEDDALLDVLDPEQGD
jgi:hypothetical protein